MAEQTKQTSSQGSVGLPRRTVAKGSLWTAPAIVVATAVPAYASHSGPHCSITASLTRLSCRDAATNTFELVLCFTSTCPGTANLVLQGISSETGGYQSKRQFYVLTQDSPQCQQVSYTYANPSFPPAAFTVNTSYRYADGTSGNEVFPLEAPTRAC